MDDDPVITNVPGFPDFLSFGGYADLTNLATAEEDFVKARASSIFAFAGKDGAGDPEEHLEDDASTRRTIALARSVEQKKQTSGDDTNNSSAVLPILVAHTISISLSSGDVRTALQTSPKLEHTFANIIITLQTAQEHKDTHHPVPAAIILNPAFLAECQKNSLPADHGMPVLEPLARALEHRGLPPTEIPERVTNTLQGYVQAVNWLIKTVAPAVSFGWSVDIWGSGSAAWVYEGPEGAGDEAQKIAAYIKTLGVFDDDSGDKTHRPDFVAIASHDVEDWASLSRRYGAAEWERFFDFCGKLVHELQIPALAWQVPASRISTTRDVSNLKKIKLWGSSNLFGDDDSGPNVDVVALDSTEQQKADLDEDLFGGGAQQFFNLSSEPTMQSLPSRGIFAVLLRGIGTQVGQVKAYMEDPVGLDDHDKI